MKTKNLITICVCLITIMFIGCKTNETPAQKKQLELETIQKIEEPNFTFRADQLQTQGGRLIHLNSYFYLTITKTTIESYLPYFGRLYAPIFDINDLGVKFRSTNFDYDSKLTKKGIYEIKIHPNDIADRELNGLTMRLTITSAEYATLSIQMLDRQGVTYFGSVE